MSASIVLGILDLEDDELTQNPGESLLIEQVCGDRQCRELKARGRPKLDSVQARNVKHET